MRTLICLFGRCLLSLRYRIRFKGLENIKTGHDRRGILFLPTHPALIDPFILMCRLYPRFRCRILGDTDQVSRFFLNWWAKRFGVIRIPDPAKHGAAVRDEVEQGLRECGRLLAAGENLILYPAGHIMGAHKEHIGGNSGVEKMLRAAPDARVVLVRTRGLWGSIFSRAGGSSPELGPVFRKALKALLLNGIFFMPRRPVEITVWEPEKFPAREKRRKVNAFIEDFFNENAPPNTYVPYYHWERKGIHYVPEPETRKVPIDSRRIPPAVKKLATEKIRETTGCERVEESMKLDDDLGLDSLARLDLVIWIEREFGFQIANPDMLETVMDVFAAATGETLAGKVDRLRTVPKRWFEQLPCSEISGLRLPPGSRLTDIFLARAAENPDAPIVADQNTGVKTYRDIITALLVLKPLLAQMPGNYLGIMLPAAPVAGIVYLAALFAGKTPVMLNWTSGRRQLDHMTESLDIKSIVTARKLTAKLREQGVRFGASERAFAHLEDLAGGVALYRKLCAKLLSFLSWRRLHGGGGADDTAVVLFTSGSENLPKAVPLTHGNILANLRDILAINALRADDIMIGFLPPFHSFGLTVTVILPLLAGLRTVYHANPTEGCILARLIRHYRATVLLGTPTFLNGIIKGAQAQDLRTLRIAVTGAEKCPAHVYGALNEIAPGLSVLEGYGITECSPVVSVNRPDNPVPFSIGRIMDSLEYRIVDEETGATCPPGKRGVLLVRGPSVFGGYLKHEGASPFVEHEGKIYYRTGDLVEADEHGNLYFKGRLKRFVKLGGEMISLPAIEEVLNHHYNRNATDEGPSLAVEAINEDAPEITLFTCREIRREEVNKVIRDSGLSALHNIRNVVRVKEIPVLGTGKTDYRTLKRIAGT